MNKKGAIFHWIILGILFSVGAFFFWSSITGTSFLMKGVWHTNFLEETIIEQQKEQVVIDVLSRRAGQFAVLDFVSSGGILEETVCSVVGPFPLWNVKNEWCLPLVEEELLALASQKLTETIWDNEFTDVTLIGSVFSGVGDEIDTHSTKKSYIKYSYTTGFAVDIGYSTSEFALVTAGARDAVNKCQNRKDLDSCLLEFSLNNPTWKICGVEGLPRQHSFCVSSDTKLFNEQGELEKIEYRFSLDFTPTLPFVVEFVDLGYDAAAQRYEIKFASDENVDSYMIYFTDYIAIEDRQGTAFQLASEVKFGGFWASVPIHSVEQKCPAVKQANTAYSCDGEVLYVLEDARIVEGEYLFAVTTVQGAEESQIERFVKGSVS
jgi:hypothetical protein